MTSSIEDGGDRRSYTNFGDDVTTRHQIQPVKGCGLYVSKGINFSLLIRRTTVNICVKYPGKQNLFQMNNEIIIFRMFLEMDRGADTGVYFYWIGFYFTHYANKITTFI